MRQLSLDSDFRLKAGFIRHELADHDLELRGQFSVTPHIYVTQYLELSHVREGMYMARRASSADSGSSGRWLLGSPKHCIVGPLVEIGQCLFWVRKISNSNPMLGLTFAMSSALQVHASSFAADCGRASAGSFSQRGGGN